MKAVDAGALAAPAPAHLHASAHAILAAVVMKLAAKAVALLGQDLDEPAGLLHLAPL